MKNAKVIIKTPRGAIVQGQGGKARIEYAQGFGAKMTSKLLSAQEFVDSEVLRRSAKYTPLRTGALIKSGILGTDIGSGEASWIVPYAATQYYGTPRTRGYDALRGGYWFERMKNIEGVAILAGAKRLAGGR